MDKAIKRKWVKALRSGKYEQARNHLRVTEGDKARHCCLGVLVEVCGGTWKETDWGTVPYIGKRRLGSKNEPDGLLTDKFLKEIGLNNNDQQDLSKRNDGMGDFWAAPQSFEQIADHIEEAL